MIFEVSLFCAKYNLFEKPVEILDGNLPETFQGFKKKYANQSGIYAWVHKQSLKTYVGSATNLSTRPFRHLYFSTATNSHFKNALKKYGVESFALVLLKVLGKSIEISSLELQQAEDIYLNMISNKYNILEKAYTSKGYKHTFESLEKIRQSRLGTSLSEETKEKLSKRFSEEQNPFFGKKHSEEFKENLRQVRKGSLNPMFGKPKSKEFLFYANRQKNGKHNFISKPVQLTHTITKEVLKFESQIEAALYFGYKTKYVIAKALKNQALFLNVWKVESIKVSFFYLLFKLFLKKDACWNAPTLS